MRIAILMNLAPRKLGSFEDWIAELCRTAKQRRHTVDVYGRSPAHPSFLEQLRSADAGWATVESLERTSW